MSPSWMWFFAILGGLGALVGIGWFLWWLFERLRKKKKTKKKLTNRQLTIRGIIISVIAAVVIGGFYFFLTLVCQKKPDTKRNDVDSSYTPSTIETPSRKDTVIHIHKKEEETEEKPEESKKPDDTTCVIIYYAGDSCSEMDAQTVKEYLETLNTSLFNSFVIIPKDSAWFNERAGFKVNPEVIDTGTAAKILMNPTLEEKKERWVYFRIKEGLYVHDATKGWVRHDTLALNKPGSKVTFADIQPGARKTPVDLLEKYAILLVLPPYPFYTRAH